MFSLKAGLAWVLFAALLGSAHPSFSQISRSHTSLHIPPLTYTMTPYVNGDSLVVHLQPLERNSAELLIDVRTGQPWNGTLSKVMSSHRRMGSENPQNVINASPRQLDLKLLAELGCGLKYQSCTSPDDEDILLFMAYDSRSSMLDLDIVDLRELMNGMSDFLSGKDIATAQQWSDSDWRVLLYGTRQPVHREQWLNAIRSIIDLQRIGQLRDSLKKEGALGGQGVFTILGLPKPTGIDLIGELKLAYYKLDTRKMAGAWLIYPTNDNAIKLAETIESSIRPPNQGRVSTHVVAVLMEFSDSERLKLSQLLMIQSRARHSEDLECFSSWVLGKSCNLAVKSSDQISDSKSVLLGAIRSPISALKNPSKKRAPSANSQSTESATPDVSSPNYDSISVVNFSAPISIGASPIIASDAPEEWSLIKRIKNPLSLFVFDESSGRMTREAASAGGLSFVARSLGAIEEGRFEVQVAPSGRAPVRFSHGQYRVKVSFVLNYTREDSCNGKVICLFSASENHSKTERRIVVFNLAGGNRWTDTKPSSFGHLLPLTADGNNRYISRLKEARLSVENVHVELN